MMRHTVSSVKTLLLVDDLLKLFKIYNFMVWGIPEA